MEKSSPSIYRDVHGLTTFKAVLSVRPNSYKMDAFVPKYQYYGQSAWNIPYLNGKIFLFYYQIFKSDLFFVIELLKLG